MPTQRKNIEIKTLQKNTNRDNAHLSGRECEILDQLSRGDCNQAPGDSLGVTVNTVEKHLTNIYKKLGSHQEQRPPYGG